MAGLTDDSISSITIRVGGDEMAPLLPEAAKETGPAHGPSGAYQTVVEVESQHDIREYREMKHRCWPNVRGVCRLVRPHNKREQVWSILALLIFLVCVMFFVLMLTFSIFWQDCDEKLNAIPPSRKPFTDFLTAPQGSWSKIAVATDTPQCSQMATELIQTGGNAVDGAVFTALCLGVLSPSSSGVGGGGIMMVRDAAATNSKVVAIDCREEAPGAANETMYVGREDLQQYGALSVAVPGLFHCLWEAHSRYGKMNWTQLVMPVAQLARNFTIDQFLASAIVSNQATMLQDPILTALFFADGRPKPQGATVQWTSLAATLEIIANEGIAPLYTGRLAVQLAQDIQQAGGIVTAADLANYSAVIRDPVSTFFSGYEMYSAPLPFGGPVMLMAFNILEGYMVPATPITQHWMVEAWKFAYGDRLSLGDPAFVPNATLYVQVMLDKQHAAKLRQRLNPNATLPDPSDYQDLFDLSESPEDHGTTHFSIVTETAAVAMTSTINLGFGSNFVSPQTGILLNDEMDDFSSPGTSNHFGYPPSQNNYIQPGKRPLSSMSPTMVLKNGELFIAAGASGGSRIITATFQCILNVLLDQMDAGQAIGAPRLHDQLLPDVLEMEPEYPSAEYLYFLGSKALAQMGYNLTVDGYNSAAQMIIRTVNPDNSVTLNAASDWRKYGQPFGAN